MNTTVPVSNPQFSKPISPADARARRAKLISVTTEIRSTLARSKVSGGIVPSKYSGSTNYHEWRRDHLDRMHQNEAESLFLKPFCEASAKDITEVVRAQQLGEFVEPQSLTEAHQRFDTLTTKVQAVQAELSNRTRLDKKGERIGTESFMAWRRRTLVDLQKLQEEKRLLKIWKRDQSLRMSEAKLNDLDLANPVDLVRGVNSIMRKHIGDWDSLPPDARTLMTAIHAFCCR